MQHLYHIGHYNPKGYVQRDCTPCYSNSIPPLFLAHTLLAITLPTSRVCLLFAAISCRKDHHTSPTAHFAPGFDKGGSPIARSGYMAPCKKHSDCMPCGRHPLTDQHYRCQRRYVLYDTVYTDNSSNLIFLNETSGSASAFDIDLQTGAATGKTGICVDIDSSYNEGCASKIGAAVKDGLVGCMDGFTSKFLCGLSVEVLHGDLSTVQTSGNLFYEDGGRLLLGGASDHDGDGQNSPELRCTDPIGVC